ncbi:GTPase-associated protein 1-related protein [Nocardiopsis ganjiahuensis]|uniref:GTPase-associated protein 1-related protein n=1 Tax=Nocardiopsis ganjiahuensis TaxID=239984 RepID=UPI00034592F4|nr:GTPase-associated protein 1-related protein [Nocardiopsis ganjiahuensis]
MGSPQLYYTSCEHGLSGHSGYQFNAATPGVDPRVLREVERFTVYEPPRSLAAEDVGLHPVNLCYSPDLVGHPVLSRVVSSGDDPSGRPGNYFAHSLLLGANDSWDDGGPLPAELWGGGFWASAPVTATDLPGLDLPPGPLDRRRTGSWLRAHRKDLPEQLLVAVDDAIDDGLPVLLLADDDVAAHWLAALSHLLPPQRARAMSFATYSGNPEDTLVHVVAVPPHTDTRMLRSRFAVFDLAEDREGGPRTVRQHTARHQPAEPPSPDTAAVVSLVLRTGVEGTPALWSAARPYASGAERSLADWRPVLAAASLADDSARTTDPDLRAVRAWLSGAASWLRPAQTRDLLGRLLDADTDTLHEDELVDLQGVAHSVGSDGLTERLEGVMVRRSLDRIAAGAQAPPVSPMRSELVRDAARDRVSGLLDGSLGRVPSPDRAVELLRWARSGGLVLPAVALARYGRDTVAGHLAAIPPGASPAPGLVRLLHENDALRRGAAAELAGLPRPVLAELAAGPVGALFVEDRDSSTAVLRELRMLASGDSDPLCLLRGVVALRQEGRVSEAPGLADHDLDEDLLTEVWGPDRRPGTVPAVLGLVGEHTLVSPGVGRWVAETLRAAPNKDEDGEWRRALHELARHRIGRQLPEDARGLVGAWERVSAALARLDRSRGAEAPSLLPEVARSVLAHRGTAVTVVGLRGLADRLLRWHPAHAAAALSGCAEEVFVAYCRAARGRLTLPPKRGLARWSRSRPGKPPEGELAVRVFRTALALKPGVPGEPGGPSEAGRSGVPGRPERSRGRRDRGGRLLGYVLEPALLTWPRHELGKVRRALDQKSDGPEFEAWVRSLREREGGGLFGRLRRGPRRT